MDDRNELAEMFAESLQRLTRENERLAAERDALREEMEGLRLWRQRWIGTRVQHYQNYAGYDYETATAYAESDAVEMDRAYSEARDRLDAARSEDRK